MPSPSSPSTTSAAVARATWKACRRGAKNEGVLVAVVDGSLQKEQQFSDRGVKVRPDRFFPGVSRRLGYELIVAEFDVEARQRAAPMWKPHLDDPSRVERLVRSELLRRAVIVRSDDDLVRDIAQDVRLRVHQKLHLFDDRRATFETWLKRVVRNVVVDRLPRYISSNVSLEEVEEEALPAEDGFDQDVVDRLVLSSLLPVLRSEPRLGSLVEKRRNGEALTKTEMMRWGRNVQSLVELCKEMGVEGWELPR